MLPVSKILVRSPNWIGDHVMASRFYEGLRAAYPASHITLACPTEIAQLVQKHWFDSVLGLRKDQRKGWGARAFWKNTIGRQGFDCAFSLPASLSSSWLLAAAKIPWRLGFAEHLGSWFLTRSLAWRGRESGRHKSSLYCDLLDLAGAPRAHQPELPAMHEASGPIVLAPGASIALREWWGFVELARQLRKRYPRFPIVVVGAQEQKHWEEKFQSVGDSAIESRIGRTTLPEVVELCRNARLVVANDSGIAHVAATLAGAPTVVVFGPGDPKYVAPLGRQRHVARASDVPCSPCEKAYCHGRYGYQQCLRSLSVDAVLSEAQSLLEPH